MSKRNLKYKFELLIILLITIVRNTSHYLRLSTDRPCPPFMHCFNMSSVCMLTSFRKLVILSYPNLLSEFE